MASTRPALCALAMLYFAGSEGCASPTAVALPAGNVGGTWPWPLAAHRVQKVDLLIVVDTSSDMADKASALAKAVPSLVHGITDPAPDPDGGEPHPVLDVHVAVITGSLGSHGTSMCAPLAGRVPGHPHAPTKRHGDDHGSLLPRPGELPATGWVVSDVVGAEPEIAPCPRLAAGHVLTWSADKGDGAFKGASGARDLEVATSCLVRSAGEAGCAYQAPWEAAYHFLVDPAPYLTAEASCTGDACGSNKIAVTGVDNAILAQRQAFLRPDSLLAVVVLSDHDDASLKPAGLNWLPWGYGQGQMPRGWADCAKVPDDFEPETVAEFAQLHGMYNCKSCYEDPSDANCKKPWPLDGLNQDLDARTVRPFAQVQRYGYNFLWGRQRYVNGFSAAQVVGSDNLVAANPIFRGGGRNRDLVLVAGIVGVPNALVADADGAAKDLSASDWKKVIGPIGERDPHMIASIAPRAGVPKFAGDRKIDATNGGDRDIVAGDDLQYACVARRATSLPSSDCSAPDASAKNPLCDASAQPYFKAYPGLRHLRILHDLGASGLAASICNDDLRPAVAALGRKIKDALGAECVRSEISLRPDGSASCIMFEVMPSDVDGTCEAVAQGLCTPGTAPCRSPGSDFPPVDLATAAHLTLPINVTYASGVPGTESVTASVEGPNVVMRASDGQRHLVCEVLQLTDAPSSAADLQACLHDKKFHLDPAKKGGWCYAQDPAVLSKECTLGTVRFGGGARPRVGAQVFPLCLLGG